MACAWLIYGVTGVLPFPGLAIAQVLYPVLTALFVGGLVAHLYGLFGTWRNYGSPLGYATFVYGWIATVVFLGSLVVLTALSAAGVYSSFSGGLYGGFKLGLVLLGILFILEGLVHLVPPALSSSLEHRIAAFVLFVVGGALLIFVSYLGAFVLVPACLLAGKIFAKAPLTPAPPSPPTAFRAGVPPMPPGWSPPSGGTMP